ncbi:bile acid:sodium symporter family protein [Hydrogenovibrio sp. 3SP14C1]|uniref:bile acid:sodium symporter family protein n=1 Tax=Hydrogenovibrio sp. 3SP14C1 TaxID=3038774 RepID=UPI00241637DC|nr:bile acid:sodium symporter family protein [Hydrogenovibrio sp. 3SP14C1]MDG4811987.1 bile acid:sodium symporter family protein [Hydrogenovibrio sp. 3SP14C1]
MTADLLTQVILPLALFLIMFGMGLSLRPVDFKNVLAAPKAVGIGLVGQMLLLPLIAFLIAVAFKLPPEIAVGLMIIALAPGGATSNMFTYLSKGDVSLSISLTALVSLISPFSIPIITALSMTYFMGNATEFSLPIVKTILQLLVITVIPVALGMFVLAKWSQIAANIERVLKVFSVFFLFLIIVLIVLKNADNMMSFFMQAGLATLVLNIAVLILGVYLAKWAKLSEAQSTSIGFEVGIQNGTLALVVAGTLIGNSTMMIPAVTYSLLMFITGAAFAMLVTRRKSRTA